MRKVLHLLYTLLISCYLCTTWGCDQSQPPAVNPADQSIRPAVDHNIPEVDQAPGSETKPPVKPATPGPKDEAGWSSGAGGGSNPGTDYKGGSQGRNDKVATGNPDKGIVVSGPQGECGNGVVEVLPQALATCPFQLYGTTTDGPEAPSDLFAINPNDGLGSLIGTITGGVERISAIDFSPKGVLYAVGERTSDDETVLMTIDCHTAQATIIGTTGISNITDIDFDSTGRLFAYVNAGSDELGVINPVTGYYTQIGLTGLNDDGNGIGSAPFSADLLYHADSLNLSILSELTGLATAVNGLNFSSPVDNGSINAIDADFYTGKVYVSINDNGFENYIGVINLSTGTVSFLVVPAQLAPEGLDGIAWNRVYEECDPGIDTSPLPEGTFCQACALAELDCTDFTDNDFDGLADCADPDCAQQLCNDLNGCTINDTCVPNLGEFVCLGTAVNCEEIIGNECSVDVCVESSEEAGNGFFTCESSLDCAEGDFGDCTPEDNCEPGERLPDGTCPEEFVINHCSIGRCIEVPGIEFDPPTFVCEATNKATVIIEEGGCLDENPCTADECEPEDGDCNHGILDGVFCEGDENSCTNEICVVGECESNEENPFAIVDTGCDDGNQCTFFDVCNGEGSCSGLSEGGPCLVNEDCSFGQVCSGEIAGVCLGNPSQNCLNNTECLSGICLGASPGICAGGETEIPCDDGNNCTDDDVCTGATCIGETQPNNSECDDGSICTVNDICLNGTCVPGTPTNAECNDFNRCTEEVCAQVCGGSNGCDRTNIDGDIPCITEPNLLLICFEGTLECNEGEESEAGCVANDPPAPITCPIQG